MPPSDVCAGRVAVCDGVDRDVGTATGKDVDDGTGIDRVAAEAAAGLGSGGRLVESDLGRANEPGWTIGSGACARGRVARSSVSAALGRGRVADCREDLRFAVGGPDRYSWIDAAARRPERPHR